MVSYRIHPSRVIYEILNTEVIAIDFSTGNYYALIHVAKQVWELIEKQLPLHKIAELIANHYRCSLSIAAADLTLFIDQLLEAGLIEAIEGTDLQKEAVITSHSLGYEAPKLQKYTDVQNLLLLDPIHEATNAGWPEKLT